VVVKYAWRGATGQPREAVNGVENAVSIDHNCVVFCCSQPLSEEKEMAGPWVVLSVGSQLAAVVVFFAAPVAIASHSDIEHREHRMPASASLRWERYVNLGSARKLSSCISW
jgi:hypothetical protein